MNSPIFLHVGDRRDHFITSLAGPHSHLTTWQMRKILTAAIFAKIARIHRALHVDEWHFLILSPLRLSDNPLHACICHFERSETSFTIKHL